MAIQLWSRAPDRANRAAITSFGARARRTSIHCLKARNNGSVTMTEAIASSTEVPDTSQPANSLLRKASRVTAMVYQLPATTRATVTSATRNSAVGAVGSPRTFIRPARPSGPATEAGVWCVASPEGITLSGRKNRQLGGIHAQIWSQIPVGKPLQSAILLEILDQLVEGCEVRRIFIDDAAPLLAHVVASNNFEHAMRFLGPCQNVWRVIKHGVHLAGSQSRIHDGSGRGYLRLLVWLYVGP